jgi:F-type H+-transporting ATPase subunit delta
MAVANRYARALADVAEHQGDYRAIERELQDFAAAYRESADLREVFETPAVAPEDKMKVLEAILEHLGVSEVTSNFLHVLAAHYRMPLLEEIIPAFTRIANDRMGIVEVRVLAPSEIPDEARRALRAGFERVTGKQVEVEFQRQEDLIGGLLAQIRSTVYDGSVRGRLDRIREKLMAR